jgi:DNA-binding transcriptional LysR family regulator
MFDWDDPKYLRAAGRHGSTNAAARVLWVSQSIVQRSIGVLKRALARILVSREATGYELTSLARALLPLADDAAEAIERTAKATTADWREILHLTCPETVVGRLRSLADHFHQLHPA